jgi:hypothetical protein
MEALIAKRNSKFTYEPILGENGAPIRTQPIRPTEEDDKRFRVLAPFDCLTADYIAAFTRENPKSISHRFNELKREPSRWINIHEAQFKRGRDYMNDALAYCLPPKTVERLLNQENPVKKSYGCSGPLNHKLMNSWIRASYEIAVDVEEVPAEIISFHEILASENMPRISKDDPAHCIPVVVDGERRRVYPDFYPFAIKTHEYKLILDETDCDTMSLTEIGWKMMAYNIIIDHSLCFDRYGFKKAYVTWESISQPHLERMKAKLLSLNPSRKVLERNLFKRHVSLKSMTKTDRPRPTGHMLTEPWQRAGLEPFSLV